MGDGLTAIEFYLVPLRHAHVLGADAYQGWLGPEAEILEYWFRGSTAGIFPREIGDFVSNLLSVISAPCAGLARCAGNLLISQPPLVANRRERLFVFRSDVDLRALIDAGWNAEMRMFHLIPTWTPTTGACADGEDAGSALAWPFIVSCAHDGTGVQFLPGGLGPTEIRAAADEALSQAGLHHLFSEVT